MHGVKFLFSVLGEVVQWLQYTPGFTIYEKKLWYPAQEGSKTYQGPITLLAGSH